MTKENALKFWDDHIGPFQNHLSIVGSAELGVLLGLCEDEHDYYYIILTRHREIEYDTCVNRLISLKDKLTEQQYKQEIYGYDFEKWLQMEPVYLIKEMNAHNEAVYFSRAQIENSFFEIKREPPVRYR